MLPPVVPLRLSLPVRPACRRNDAEHWTHSHAILSSDHSFGRKLWLHVELFYQAFNMLFAWFSLGNWYIIFIIITQSLYVSSA